MSQSPNPPPAPPPRDPHVVIQQILQCLNILPAFAKWLCQEVSEVRKAPVAFVLTLAIGLAVGWLVVGHFRKEEIQSGLVAIGDLDRAYKNQQALATRQRTEVDSLRDRVTGLLPAEVAKQISSNLPPDRRMEIVVAKLDELLKQLQPPPLDEGLRRILNDINSEILTKLAAEKGESLTFRGEVEVSQAAALRKLCSDPEARRYIQLLPLQKGDSLEIWKSNGTKTSHLRFVLLKALLKQP
jgi:hypothetical protein